MHNVAKQSNLEEIYNSHWLLRSFLFWFSRLLIEKRLVNEAVKHARRTMAVWQNIDLELLDLHLRLSLLFA